MKKQERLLSVLILSIWIVLGLSIAPSVKATFPAHVQGQTLPSLAPMLEKVLPAVVSVHVEGIDSAQQVQEMPIPLRRFFGQLPGQHSQLEPFEGLGSGVIIDANRGYILTNNHVINGADKIIVQLNDGNEYDAQPIGFDEPTDIALIQVKTENHLSQIKIADSDALQVGDFAVAIGNPFGLGQTATSGIISALGRSGLNLEGLENFIQTDAAINRGNSGGALVNLKGELIGINTAILASSGGNMGIGFAIPSNMAMNLVQQLIQFGEIKRGRLGIKGIEMNVDIAQAFNVNVQRGAFVSEVLPKSAAEKAGIQSGDIITSINNKTIASFSELRAKVGTTPPGQRIKIGLLRQGKFVKVTVILEQNCPNSAHLMARGLQGATLSDGVTKDGRKGIKIDFIERNTPAELVGLQKDDVIIGINRTRIINLSEMRKALQKKLSVIALNIIRGEESIYILLPG
ncbi:DegQ protein [Candidatus Pantoea carbekii]|uniref:DegQ protein n=1 Tax=Candidatus Pantoea carbekii TaxID=1235990 RepID=U3U986_9GAMM|nr:DegQ protein [Candidatus Pantoea carbekii]